MGNGSKPQERFSQEARAARKKQRAEGTALATMAPERPLAKREEALPRHAPILGLPMPVLETGLFGRPKTEKFKRELAETRQVAAEITATNKALGELELSTQELEDIHDSRDERRHLTRVRLATEIRQAERAFHEVDRTLRQEQAAGAEDDRTAARDAVLDDLEYQTTEARQRAELAEAKAAALEAEAKLARAGRRTPASHAESPTGEDPDDDRDEPPPTLRPHLARSREKQRNNRWGEQRILEIIEQAGGIKNLSAADIERIDALRDALKGAEEDISLAAAADLADERP